MAKDKKKSKDSKDKKTEASINNGNRSEHNEKKLKKEPIIITKKDEKKLISKLSEHTTFKSITKQKKKNRKPVWVKKFSLYYEKELRKLQIELLKMQKHVKKEGLRIMMIFEGRDAAGKGGTLKRITEHLNPRGTRVVALLTPSDKERTEWYFQRYIQHLPSAGEIVLFDRSWYNRAMVEPVMEFCSDEQNKRFLKDVPMLEEMLVKDGIFLFKFFFSVSKNEQLRRFDSRETDPLKQYKISPVDKMAQNLWDDYSIRKFQMLNETNRTLSPWIIIRSDNKKIARLDCIKHILSKIDYKDRISLKELKTDPRIVISGIDEIRFMEDYLMEPDKLPG
ncbi:MAG: polyphosphate kinase 2 [Thermodesulfobacteriota bacterium]|nr:polyphosphate kinase 2 [Thermodesulfobacteriota bacterium]